MSFQKYLSQHSLTEAVSKDATNFMKEFNKQISLLKDDVKSSDSNDDWLHRLTSIKNLIDKQLK